MFRDEDIIQTGSDPLDFLGKTDKSIMFLGTTTKKQKEMWLTNAMVRQHMVVTGTTGSGKTEFLLGLFANAFAWGSGGIFIDGKGDISTVAKVIAMADRFNRRNDLYILNYMMGSARSEHPGRSNTFNPFQSLESDAMTNLIVNMMDDTGGDGGMWRGRASAMLTGVLRALTWMRDVKGYPLDAGVIRDHLSLRAVIDLSDPAKNPEMPFHIRKSLSSYLTALPGYKEHMWYKQGQTTLDQHGYLEMQFSRIFGVLADVYGHIFCAGHSEIDIHDIIENRRFLLVSLPAMEKSSDELANLGRIVTSTIRAMFGQTLGAEVSGGWQDAIARPVRQHAPFLCIFDEAGYYLADGMDLLAAQGRSLNVGLVFAAQDLESLFNKNPRVAHTVMVCTGTKILMRSEGARSGYHSFLDVLNIKKRKGWTLFAKERREGSLTSPLDIHDRLYSIGVGEMLVVRGGNAAFGNAPFVQFDNQTRIKITNYHPTAGNARLIAGLYRPEKSAAVRQTPLPEAFAQLQAFNETQPLPGGNAHLAAALRALSANVPPKTPDVASSGDDTINLGE